MSPPRYKTLVFQCARSLGTLLDFQLPKVKDREYFGTLFHDTKRIIFLHCNSEIFACELN